MTANQTPQRLMRMRLIPLLIIFLTQLAYMTQTYLHYITFNNNICNVQILLCTLHLYSLKFITEYEPRFMLH